MSLLGYSSIQGEGKVHGCSPSIGMANRRYISLLCNPSIKGEHKVHGSAL